MKKIGIALAILTGCALNSSAQIEDGAYYYQPALTFSQDGLLGSPRVQGYGGAQTALGGDMSALALNPAGLGVYRKSEFGMGLGLQFGSANSDFSAPSGSSSSRTTRDNLNVRNIGVVFAETFDDPGDNMAVKNWAFGIALNRTNNYNADLSYQGRNSDNSLREFLAETATNENLYYLDDLDAQYDFNEGTVADVLGAGYQQFLINTENETANPSDPSNRSYFTLDPNVANIQEELIVTDGRKQEWDFGVGANLNDFVLVGANIGISTLRYERQRIYSEEPEDNSSTDINNIQLTEIERTDGTGISASIGVIVKPSDAVRLGVSLKSPTRFRLTEEYQVRLETEWNSLTGYDPNATAPGSLALRTPLYILDYRLTTPWKLSTGIALFIGKSGFLTADLDYVGYDRMQIDPAPNDVGFIDFLPDNNTIRNLYRSAINFRVGGEYRIENYRLRAGFARNGDPFSSTANVQSDARTFITAGAGYRDRNFYADMALILGSRTNRYSPYTMNNGNEPVIETTYRNTQVELSGGVFF